MTRPAMPVPIKKLQANAERAFARAYPELKELSTVEIRLLLLHARAVGQDLVIASSELKNFVEGIRHEVHEARITELINDRGLPPS